MQRGWVRSTDRNSVGVVEMISILAQLQAAAPKTKAPILAIKKRTYGGEASFLKIAEHLKQYLGVYIDAAVLAELFDPHESIGCFNKKVHYWNKQHPEITLEFCPQTNGSSKTQWRYKI